MRLDKESLIHEPLAYTVLFVALMPFFLTLGVLCDAAELDTALIGILDIIGLIICPVLCGFSLLVGVYLWIKKRHYHRNDISGENLGKTADNPIYISSAEIVEYLKHLVSANKVALNWNCSEAENGLYAYDAYLPSGEHYGRLYLRACDVYRTEKIPEGYLQTETDQTTEKTINKRIFFTNAMTLLVSCAMVFTLLAALILQDSLRDAKESISPTIAYLVLFIMFDGLAVISFFSLKERYFVATMCLSIALLLVTVLLLADGSVTSSSYIKPSYSGTISNIEFYTNFEQISDLNRIWIQGVLFVLVVNMLHVGAALWYVWRSSVWYHDFCYRRTYRMRVYQEKDIITEGRYEKYKEELLKNVKY